MTVPVMGSPLLKSRLPLPDRLVLWAVRAWVVGLKQRIDAAVPIRTAFARHGIPEVADLVDALMSIIACGAARTLTIKYVCHDGVSEDERHLLAAAALHQQGRGFEARFLLRTMLSPTASAGAAEILDRLGARLTVAGLRLHRGLPQTERYVLAPAEHAEVADPPRPRLLH